jgi:hypothetical protein
MENKLNEAYQIVKELYEKYSNNHYMSERTHQYICNQLPNVLENIRQTHEKNVLRIEEMTIEQDNFISNFLSNNQYFYISSTEKFFFYDGLHYKIISEDDILHHVLTSITRDRNLMSWKQLTKKYIMKRIKEHSLLKSIPESDTIQNILHELLSNIFTHKNEAKYFLTILGDNIFKKNTDIIHIIDPKAKPFIRELNNICQFLIGSNLAISFKYKYHDNHDYSNCRLVKINTNIKNECVWVPLINNYMLDLICVACHYSIRFNNSDDYVNNYSSHHLFTQNVFYLKDIQPIDMVNKFIDEYLQITSSSTNAKNILSNQLFTNKETDKDKGSLVRATQITWKNMQYLWKKFLDSKELPNIMFLQTLKNLLLERLNDYYNENMDSFIGICSEHLPSIQQFIQFWTETISIDDNEIDFEIDEIIIIFKQWCETKREISSTLNDKQILDLISYYYPDIEIEKDKYICKIKCSLWDKQIDIQVALDNLKDTMRLKYYTEYNNVSNYERVTSPIDGRNISIYDAYNYYCRFFSTINGKLIVSKSYFEKYIMEILCEYIIDSKYISSDWIIY